MGLPAGGATLAWLRLTFGGPGLDLENPMFLALFATLLGLHALADYPLQGDFLSKLKDPRSPIAQAMGRGSWIHGLVAHSAIHGLFVGLATGSLVLGLLEVILHAAIDLSKVRGAIGYHLDQVLHVVCKLAWACLALDYLHTQSPLI